MLQSQSGPVSRWSLISEQLRALAKKKAAKAEEVEVWLNFGHN